MRTTESSFVEALSDDVAIVVGSVIIGDTVYGNEGTSKRNPVDEPDDELALLLCYARLFHRLSKQLQKAANIRENELARVAAQKRPKSVREPREVAEPKLKATRPSKKAGLAVKKAPKHISAKAK